MKCEHKNLKACEPVFTGIDVDADFAGEQHPASDVCGMFTFRHYECKDCGRIILVLNAVVEDTNNKETRNGK